MNPGGGGGRRPAGQLADARHPRGGDWPDRRTSNHKKTTAPDGRRQTTADQNGRQDRGLRESRNGRGGYRDDMDDHGGFEEDDGGFRDGWRVPVGDWGVGGGVRGDVVYQAPDEGLYQVREEGVEEVRAEVAPNLQQRWSHLRRVQVSYSLQFL